MILQQPSDLTFTFTPAKQVVAPRPARSAKSLDIVRAESELRAIDELMAELSEDFVSGSALAARE